MSPTPQDSFVPARGTVGDVPEFDRKLALICRGCGKKAKYKVGCILIDPYWIQKRPGKETRFEDAVSFGGLFRCKQCGSGGPWEFPTLTYMTLSTALMTQNPRQAQIHLGRMQTFDGTPARSGAEAEDYLKEKLEEYPEDAFLWDRLGNLYDHAGERELARSAYEKAVDLDPAEIEANYTLGCYRMEDGDYHGAAECFERIALHARNAPRRDPELLENIVRESLSSLFELHCETEGEIPFPPKLPRAPVPDDEPHVVYISNLDLDSEEGWDMLTSICLTGKLPERARPRERERGRQPSPETADDLAPPFLGRSEESRPGDLQEGVATVRKSRRVGRNERCPCGSGKKYKRCCGRV